MKDTFSFLRSLAKNNDREWFEANRTKYERARGEFEQLLGKVLKEIGKFDKAIDAGTPAKDFMFRIYKDVRFSKDKTPYKTHFGASMNPGGRKSPEAGYYLHAEPGNSFIAGGVWMPDPAHLAAIRQEIDYHADDLKKIMSDKTFRKHFKGLDEEGALKTTPKGYDKEHPHIDLIRNRHFIVSEMIPDKSMLADPTKTIVAGFKAMYPLMQFLRRATH
jgi:uncharacterized protein (TIGR02453 family)